MMNFVNHGSDEDLLKSLRNDERIDQEILEKAIDKSKLVQVERQVQGKNKMFTRKQWVKAGDVQSADKVVGKQPQVIDKKLASSEASDTKSSYDEAFGKLPYGYMSASEDTKISYYNTQLTNKQKELSEAEKSKAEYEDMFVSGKFDGKIPESKALSNITFYKKKVDELNETIDKMKSALGDKAKQSKDKKPNDSGKATTVDANEFAGLSKDDLRKKLNELPVGTKISGVRSASGRYDFDISIEKHEGYQTNYGAMSRYGGSVKDNNQKSTWWEVSGSKTNEFDLADILTGKSKYYNVTSQTKQNSPKPNDSKSSDTKPQQPKQKSTKLNDSKSSDTKPQQPKQKSTHFKADQATKNTVNNISQKMGNDKLLSWCRSVGVTWTENDHKGINIMRAKMALAQAIQEGKVSVGPKTSGKSDSPKSNDTKKDNDPDINLSDYTQLTSEKQSGTNEGEAHNLIVGYLKSNGLKPTDENVKKAARKFATEHDKLAAKTQNKDEQKHAEDMTKVFDKLAGNETKTPKSDDKGSSSHTKTDVAVAKELQGITNTTQLRNKLRAFIKKNLGDKYGTPKYRHSSIKGYKPISVHGLSMNIEGEGSDSEKLVLHHTSNNTDTLENLKSLLESNGINVTYYLDNPNSDSLQIYSHDIYRKK